jgi:hypothetical protein
MVRVFEEKSNRIINRRYVGFVHCKSQGREAAVREVLEHGKGKKGNTGQKRAL